MNQVIVNGVSYLGTLVEDEGNVEVKDAVQTGNTITKADVTRWFEKNNTDELETVRFGGNGISFSVINLTDDVEMFIKMAELVMIQAKSVAVRKLENREFRGGLGKL